MSLARTIATRAKGWLEGAWRGPFLGVGEFGGTYELGSIEDGYQRNLDIRGYGVRNVPAAFAAVMATAKAVSQCWPQHLREGKPKQFSQVTTSPAFRIFRTPNAYETWPVFALNLVASMLFDGNAYAVGLRDDRGAILSLHRVPSGSAMPYVAEDGSVHYTVGANQLMPGSMVDGYMVPARDVLHLRQYCPRHPLLGESAFVASALALGVNVALSRSQAVFFSRMSRPSGVLTTDQALGKDQIARLRENWNAQTALMMQGGVPILGNAVKFSPMTINSQDSQLIEAQRLSIEDIARVCNVPLPVIGDLSHATLTNVEALISFWLSTGLGSLLELIEREFDRLFQFDGVTDYTDLDVTALLRTELAQRVDALTKGIQGGLYTPDEARSKEGLPPVPFGDVPYVQQQMVPLGTKPQAPAPAPAPDNKPSNEDPPPPDAPPEPKPQADNARRLKLSSAYLRDALEATP